MGYNLAIEYLADFEKTWMLDSFKELDSRVLQPQQRPLKEWLFLEVHEAPYCAVQTYIVSLIDWILDTRSQGYTDLQRLLQCLYHRGIVLVLDTVCSKQGSC